MEEKIVIKAYEEICTISEILSLTDQGLMSPDQTVDMIKRLIWTPQSSLGLSRGYLEAEAEPLDLITEPAEFIPEIPVQTKRGRPPMKKKRGRPKKQ